MPGCGACPPAAGILRRNERYNPARCQTVALCDVPGNISHACDVDCVLDYLMNEFEISAFSLESIDLQAMMNREKSSITVTR